MAEHITEANMKAIMNSCVLTTAGASKSACLPAMMQATVGEILEAVG